MVNKRLSTILNDKIKLCEKTWDPWIKYLTGDICYISHDVFLDQAGGTIFPDFSLSLCYFIVTIYCYFNAQRCTQEITDLDPGAIAYHMLENGFPL